MREKGEGLRVEKSSGIKRCGFRFRVGKGEGRECLGMAY